MKTTLTFFLLIIGFIVNGQSPQVQELGKLYMSGDLVQTINKANEYLKSDPDNIEYKLILGRALADNGDYESAIPNLNYAANNAPTNSWQRAWGLGYLGTCHFMLQDYDKSRKWTKECIDLDATKNATQYAYKRVLLFGFDDFYKDWKIEESDNFRFHFQNMSDSDIERYISRREIAFKNINEFFESELPKKIDFFVWNSTDDAKNLLGTNLGFADPYFSIVHSHFNQSKGHEMTHVISNYSTKVIKKTGLINEGTAVCFDQSRNDKEKVIKNWLKNNDKKIAIREVWTDWRAYPAELNYPLSGLFVKELIDNFGKDKFLEFFKNQTYENAQLVYGMELFMFIKEFENKINT